MEHNQTTLQRNGQDFHVMSEFAMETLGGLHIDARYFVVEDDTWTVNGDHAEATVLVYDDEGNIDEANKFKIEMKLTRIE